MRIVHGLAATAILFAFVPSASAAGIGAMDVERAADAWMEEARQTVVWQLRYADHAIEAARRPRLTGADREVLAAQMAVRYVSNRMNVLRYGALAELENRPPKTTSDAMLAGAGICGNHAEAAIRLIRLLGLKARSVQFYRYGPHGDQSHVVVEAFAGGRWRLLDVTWRAWFLRDESRSFDIASADDLEKEGRAAFHLVKDDASPSSLVSELVSGDVLSYLDPWPEKTRIVGQSGVVPLLASGGAWRPVNAPDFIGRTVDLGALAEGGGVTARIAAGSLRIRSLTIEGVRTACDASGRIVARAGGAVVAQAPAVAETESRTLTFLREVRGADVTLAVEGGAPGTACYIVYDGVMSDAAAGL